MSGLIWPTACVFAFFAGSLLMNFMWFAFVREATASGDLLFAGRHYAVLGPAYAGQRKDSHRTVDALVIQGVWTVEPSVRGDFYG